MNWELIIVISLILMLFVLKTLAWNKLVSKEPDEEKFVWQPDLSHHVIITERPPGTSKAKEQVIQLVEKSEEDRDEERIRYLRDRSS
jgi:hypothetical protein